MLAYFYCRALGPLTVLTLASSFNRPTQSSSGVLTLLPFLQIHGLAYKKLWSIATLCFAATQLIGGLSFSALQHFAVTYINSLV